VANALNIGTFPRKRTNPPARKPLSGTHYRASQEAIPARELLGLTQKDAALLAQVSEREWRAIEVGKSDPTATVLACATRE
jgi:DNA-binding XRE family transcriptional regulator